MTPAQMLMWYGYVKAHIRITPDTVTVEPMNDTLWHFYRWLLRIIHDTEQLARDERLTGLPAYHDAITGDLTWLI